MFWFKPKDISLCGDLVASLYWKCKNLLTIWILLYGEKSEGNQKEGQGEKWQVHVQASQKPFVGCRLTRTILKLEKSQNWSKTNVYKSTASISMKLFNEIYIECCFKLLFNGLNTFWAFFLIINFVLMETLFCCSSNTAWDVSRGKHWIGTVYNITECVKSAQRAKLQI